MTVSQFLSILRARKGLALLVLLLTVGVTAAVSFMLPKKYSAMASIVVDAKPDAISGLLYPGMGTPAFIATQVDVMRSDRVTFRMIESLKLTENPILREEWLSETKGKEAMEGWLIGKFQRDLEVKPSIESNVINVGFVSSDPKLSADLANGVVRAFLDIALELRVDPARQSSQFFDVRAKEARAALEKAQARLSAYQREKGVIVNDDRFDVESQRLNELSTQLVMLQTLSSESGSRQAQVQNSADRLQEVLNSPLIAGLKADLSRSEARLQELSSRLGDNHPQVVEAKATVNSLRGRIDSETRRVGGGVSVTANINRQREAELRGAMEAQRQKVQRMKVVREEGGVLVRDMESAQRSYDTILERLNQSSLESQTNQSNMYMLAEAWAPTRPSSPKIPLNVALATVIGVMLAAGAALAVESADRRVRSNDDVSIAIGLPVIGVMPPPTLKIAGDPRQALLSRRVVGQLPMPTGRS